MSPTSTRSGGIFSKLIGLILVSIVLFIIFGWPRYLASHGSAAPGVISAKVETMRVNAGEWFRRFQIVATYSIPGQLLIHRTMCDVDEKTYDALRITDKVEVRYFTALLQQPFIPSSQLAPCTVSASLFASSPVLLRLVITFAGVLFILLLWKVFRSRLFVWLLLAWIGVAFVMIGLPRVQPEPEHPVAATGTIDRVYVIRTLGDAPDNRSIPLTHPYELVLIKFVPQGMDTPVTAVDKIDVEGAPDLKSGTSVNITYDSQQPRVARLQQGTRLFPGRTLRIVMLCGIAYLLLVAIGAAIAGGFRLLGRKASEVVKQNVPYRPRP